MAVERGDHPLAASLVSDAEAVVKDTLSGAHFVAMFPRLAAGRLQARDGHWTAARDAGQHAAELARRGAGRVELAAALLTAAAAARTCPSPSGGGTELADAGAAGPADEAESNGSETAASGSDPGALVREARGVLRHCPDPGPVVTAWLAEEERAESARSRLHAMIEPLTDRELGILRLLPAPTPQRELASALFVTPNTLKTHLRAIYRKLGAESRDDAVIRARERGLI
jgi:LuxR family maltose regulon positive regulatory protein